MKRCMHWFGAGFAILLLIVITVPYLIPMEQYKEHIEDLISEATGYQIEISSIHFKVLPAPAIKISKLRITRKAKQTIHVKNEGDHQELLAEKIYIPLMFEKLLKGKVVVSRLALEGVLADKELLWEFIESFQSSDDQQATDGPSSFELHLVEAKGVRLRFRNGKVLGPYQLSLSPDMEIGFSKMKISREDGTAQLEITQDKETIHYNLTAGDWKEPLGYPFLLKSIKVEGIQSGSYLIFSEIDAEVFDGNLTGKGVLSWQSDWKTSGDVVLSGIDLKKVSSLLELKEITGKLDSDCKFSLTAHSVGKMFDTPDIQCKYDIVAFGGKIAGEGYLLNQNGWQSSGLLKTENLDLKKALQYFDKESISGNLNTDCSYSLSANVASELLQNPSISCDYTILDGEIYKADLENAASLTSSKDHESGGTPFSKLSGNMNLENKNIVITNLNLDSSSLEVSGKLKVKQYTNLSGQLNVSVKKTASLASIPLKISGTVSEPEFRPTNSVIAGGTVGTFLLGPGVGTAIGMKIGKGISMLFGGGDDETDKSESNGNDESEN